MKQFTERCAHENQEEKLLPKGSAQYGKIVCADCGAFLKWMPFPTGLDGKVIPDCEDGPLPDLVGSQAQIKWATSLRARLLAELAVGGPKNLYLAARQIVQASWWIANRDKPVAQMHWPASWSGDEETVRPSPPAASEAAQPEPARSGFDATLEALEPEGWCRLCVTFDGGRSSGNLTFTRHELERVHRAIGLFLRRKYNSLDE